MLGNLISYCWNDPHYNDTLLKMLARKTEIILEQSEQIKALEQENKQLKEKLGIQL